MVLASTFPLRIELDATPSNGVDMFFWRDVDGDGFLSRLEDDSTNKDAIWLLT